MASRFESFDRPIASRLAGAPEPQYVENASAKPAGSRLGFRLFLSAPRKASQLPWSIRSGTPATTGLMADPTASPNVIPRNSGVGQTQDQRNQSTPSGYGGSTMASSRRRRTVGWMRPSRKRRRVVAGKKFRLSPGFKTREAKGKMDPYGNRQLCFAEVDHPIPVRFARDEEIASGDTETNTRNHHITCPPPAYGLWRGSMRIDPNMIYWQRVDRRTSEGAVNSSPIAETRPPTANRPPSYISDDGVQYVVDIQPRSHVRPPSPVQMLDAPSRHSSERNRNQMA
ncbi:hypothetical protein PRK78_005354 [Emydomyces testavorans]|uniref:Uncharacterized protein n=1 Tax=Emydomyces testavorans TaxID=2070801 RepID=A0AAF0DKJ6_9EURO|nr:hypothetical protein PRK78_005354 [Emydomyces testavorans]